MEKSTPAARLLLFNLFILGFQAHSAFLSSANASAYDQDFSYMKIVKDATDLPLVNTYDYIVVGGGTAGCPLAATLSANYTVLVLERGGAPTTHPNVLKEEGFLSTLMQEDDGKTTPAQRFTSEDGVAIVRGRVLGGSTMINAGFYSRADKQFFIKSGIDWDIDLVENAYQWVENTVVSRPNLLRTNWQSVVKEALLEAGVGPDNGFSLDHIKGTKVGGSTFDSDGRRHGADQLLNKGNIRNLQVGIHATVERIIFSSKGSSISARGVRYTDSNGRSHWAFVRGKREVILSAGAIGSPQLLLLSGVGPQSYLSSLKIPVVHPQPYTGNFMYDNPRNFINILSPIPLQPSNVKIVGITDHFYVETFSSLPISTIPFSIFSDPTKPVEINSSWGHIAVKSEGPSSYGTLKLQSSSDVKVGPSVRFNYFADPLDLDYCVSGMKMIGELLNTESLRPFKVQASSGTKAYQFYGQTLPMNETDDASFGQFCRDTVSTFWHFHGGCLVGKVVDSSLRVMGIDGLRIVDASTFNFTPGTNPQASLMMLGRYIGTKMLQQRSS
ncbi:(R)-mandelonitrile lyase 1-like [Argentina anserina]|uniref:(R)-mandelonitrile lyase 1-like n=1 Tax=Argentina anserina TaxID=57926 RepID=UPI0021767A09|nr:(R)-mandelonitrile lyase 1-like [Potentilla anserina]